MTSADHRALREQLGAYALGQLAGEEARATQAHLEVCADCRAEVDALVPVAAALRTVDPDWLDEAPSAPPPLSPAVLREVRSGRRGSTAPESGRSRRALLLTAAAGVATVAAAGGIGYRAGVGTTAPSVGELAPVRAITPQIRANANLVAHTWGMEVKLTATGFEPGEAYRVSVTDRAGRTVNAGEFIGTGEAEMWCNLNSSVLRADAASFQVRDSAGDVVLTAAL